MAQLSFKDEKANKITSPEQVNDYIKTSNPAAWLIILSAVFLLASIFVWAIFGTLDVTVKAGGVATKDGIVCYLPESEDVAVGDKVKAGGVWGEVVSVSEKPVSKTQIKESLDVDEYTLYCLDLNEWNYIKGWSGDDWRYSLKMEKGLKGSSFALGAMCIGQALPLDMLMYYDARPCGMNGLFDTDTLKPLKTYYAYKAFAHLRELGNCASVEIDGENLYAVCATNDSESAMLITSYNDDDNAPTKDIRILVTGAKKGECIKAEYYALNEQRNMELMREEYFTADVFTIRLLIQNHESYLIKFVAEK